MSSETPDPLDSAVGNAARLLANLNETLAEMSVAPAPEISEMRLLLESAERRLATRTVEERTARLDARRLSRALTEMTEERDRLSRDRKRSAATGAELRAQNEQLADSAVDTRMEVIRLRAQLAKLEDRLAAEQAATDYARERGARLHGELLEERRLRRMQARSSTPRTSRSLSSEPRAS